MAMPREPRVAAGAAFRREAAAPSFPIPVKNTFINFDVYGPRPTGGRARAASCPASPASGPSLEAAAKELCHGMAPRTKGAELTARAGRRVRGTGSSKPLESAEDSISEVSTGISDHETHASTSGTPVSETASAQKPQRKRELMANQPMPRATPGPGPTGPPKGQAEEAPTQARRGDKGGKGLNNFTRLEVGIEDDRDFRVVQRLIGPKGRHMSDIVDEARGAKVWIIGRGSRSREDNEGPLMVCVGAASGSAFARAVGLVQGLLSKVRVERDRFQPRRW